MDSIEAVFRISGHAPLARADSILLEQTVETPRAVAERNAYVREYLMGRVARVEPHPDDGYLATLELPVETAATDAAQFLNVLFGNSSLHRDVQLEDFRLPATICRLFPGPRFGIEGIRRILAADARPLTCSALKPVGLTTVEIGRICRAFAEGGIDLIKDDHYLANQAFAPFDERVRTCQDVVEDVAARTGHRAAYVPNLSGTPDAVRRQAESAMERGVAAVMVAPMLLGMPLLHELCTKVIDVPVLAHPSFAGALRIKESTLLGKLFRLYGADAVIFANYGGRFGSSPEVCRDVADTLRSEWLGIRPAFPVPAGGMDASRAPELVRFFGRDTILLVGGSLLEAGDELREATERFSESVRVAARALRNDQP